MMMIKPHKTANAGKLIAPFKEISHPPSAAHVMTPAHQPIMLAPRRDAVEYQKCDSERGYYHRKPEKAALLEYGFFGVLVHANPPVSRIYASNIEGMQ